jgi:hypothetical protein
MTRVASRSRLLALVALGAVATAPAGCAHHAEGPAITLAAFGAALERGDLPAAYALTSSEFRGRTPFEAFAAAFKAGGGEPAALGARMVAEAGRAPPRLELELALGEPVPLVIEDGRWRIDGPVYEAWGQGTPRAAVRTLIRALDERRYDIVLRLVPSRYRAGLSVEKLRAYWEGPRKEDNRALLAELRAAAKAPIVEAGDEARLPYPPDREVRLVREDGQWKVEDLDQNHFVTNREH